MQRESDSLIDQSDQILDQMERLGNCLYYVLVLHYFFKEKEYEKTCDELLSELDDNNHVVQTIREKIARLESGEAGHFKQW